MGKEKSLSIKTVPVEIRVITVDGKRMTKSVFDQIIVGDGEMFSFTNQTFAQTSHPLGWVKWKPQRGDGDTYLIYSKNGVLYKNRKNTVLSKRFSIINIPGRPESVKDLRNALANSEWAIRCLFKVEDVDFFDLEYFYSTPYPDFDENEFKRESYDASVKEMDGFRPIVNDIFNTYNMFKPDIVAMGKAIDSLFNDENQIFISI